ncbi:enoyl-CoA hydratase/isomerase family protein [Caldalkalibacillus mannanilyticus]|uniref:enoyl-CoA hydratase/isomerase family protein n=1 Tax=Caldalkalibacillus mannanilyticus TaxID=1418 RepID=UPI00046A51F9|nr:enoyl-CoA hydratase/isomerase family protein [Caldalkalibacillus mannanilyticus]
MLHKEIINSIGVIKLVRPEVHNAINIDVMKQLKESIASFKENPEVKMLLVTGSGNKYFCSGGDIEEFHSLDMDSTENMLHYMKEVLFDLQTFPKPTVAVLNGSALGGGCEVVTACDFRIAHPQVELGFIQIKLGITTGWGGATRLFDKLPASKAFKWLLSGEKIQSDEAFQWGFIDQLFPQAELFEKSLEWCQSITQHSLPALMSYKHTLLDQKDLSLSMKEKLTREVGRSVEIWGSPEHQKVVERFLATKKSK